MSLRNMPSAQGQADPLDLKRRGEGPIGFGVVWFGLVRFRWRVWDWALMRGAPSARRMSKGQKQGTNKMHGHTHIASGTSPTPFHNTMDHNLKHNHCVGP